MEPEQEQQAFDHLESRAVCCTGLPADDFDTHYVEKEENELVGAWLRSTEKTYFSILLMDARSSLQAHKRRAF